jgi:LmbE family N-acetylglucosaminyl deacetylase
MKAENKIVRRVALLAAFVALWTGMSVRAQEGLPITPITALALLPSDRVLIMAPHPDDEVLGCGGVIQQCISNNIPVKIVFLTYGDNNQWSFAVYRKHLVLAPGAIEAMGLVRHDEAIQADGELGLAPSQLVFLGYPDFGTFHIWTSHWGHQPAFRSMLTRVTAVPYENAFRPGAPYKGEEVLRDIKAVFRDFRPTKVFLSHPADYNPDHRALYLFTRVALWDLEAEMQPNIFPYLIHFPEWPAPRGYHPSLSLEPPAQFQGVQWKTEALSPDGVTRNYAAIQKHRSQFTVSTHYLDSFIRTNELFGDLPEVRLAPGMTNTPPVGVQERYTVATPSAELLDEERAEFIGFESRSVRMDESNLFVTVSLSRPLAKTVEMSLEIFGYRHDLAFEEMPKIHLRIGALGYRVYDRDQRLIAGGVKVTRGMKTVTIRVPLATAGFPQHILTSARTFMGNVPLDAISWRILEAPH